MKKINKILKNIKLLILDVDGVLTKGEIIYDDRGRELKMFNVKDGLGVSLLAKAGVPTIFLTAKDGKVVHRRAKDMGVKEVFAGILPKESVLEEIKQKYAVNENQICFIGDDLIDLGLINKVGLGVACADAAQAVRKQAKYVTKANGGDGAVREIVDLLIQAQGLAPVIYAWLKDPKKQNNKK